jgi:hypothetical protein
MPSTIRTCPTFRADRHSGPRTGSRSRPTSRVTGGTLGLQPGSLVLTADARERVAELQAGSLPPAPVDYNPLGLAVVP